MTDVYASTGIVQASALVASLGVWFAYECVTLARATINAPGTG